MEDNADDLQADEIRAARSLLAIALETLPADQGTVGDDLMRAVRLRRTCRRRTRAFVSAGAAVAAAGAVAAVLLSVTVAAAPHALAVVSGALSRASAQSFSMKLTVTQTQHDLGDTIMRSPLHITAELDLKRKLGLETLSNGWQTRIVGGQAYTKIRPSEEKAYGTGGKPWTHAELADELPPYGSAGGRLAWDLNSAQPFNPQALLTLLRSAATVVYAGPVSGPGWTGDRYRFSLSHPTGTGGLVDSIKGTIDVDRQGNIRSLFQTTAFARFDQHGNPGPGVGTVYTLDFTFSDFGIRFSVTPPPVSQTDRDIGVFFQF